MPEIDSLEDARRMAGERIRAGADGIKIFAGSAGVPGPPLRREYIQAAADAAHHGRKLVFAHPQHRAGLENAVEGGVDVLAHATVQAEVWEDALVQRMRRKRMALIPTLKLFRFEAARDRESPAEIERWAAITREQLRAFVQRGGEVLFGTDVGYMDDFDPGEEYELMARAGMTWRRILESLTVAPARRFGDRRKGSIRRGWEADVVVLAADPGVDVRNFARVELVLREGKMLFAAPPVVGESRYAHDQLPQR